MRMFLALCFFLPFSYPTLSQIHIDTNQVWQADTVYVNQNLIVDVGATLTINAGTVVLFTDKNFIDVYGQLIIAGAIEDSVVMTAPDTTWFASNTGKVFYGWGGIYAYGNGTVNAQYTVFDKLGLSTHSKNGNAVFGAIRNESTIAMTFEHCIFKLKRDAQQTYEGCDIEGYKASVIIRNCSFTNNKGAGSLVSITSSGSLTILNTKFSGNDMFGSLIYAESASYQIKACHFENNRVRAMLVGATYNSSSSFEENTITNNVGAIELRGIFSSIFFRNNLYAYNGGQIYFELGNNIITGNVFLGNRYEDIYNYFGNDYDGIVRIEYTEVSAPVIANNSFINNSAVGLRMWSVNKFTIVNNIFYNNYPLDCTLPSAEYLNTNDRIFQYNLYPSAVGGEGNISKNPRLNEYLNGFSLATNSPAIDKGNSNYSDYLLPKDLLGNPRYKNSIDIGAIECNCNYLPLSDINISNTIVTQKQIGQEVAQFTTTSPYDINAVTYSFANVNGVNNDYFLIDGDKLLLKKELTTETLLRIKIRAEHISGGWLEEYFDLTAVPLVTGVIPNEALRLNIFPVPADKILYFDKQVRGIKYSIFSATGVKIESNQLTDGSIDISTLKDGVYILYLTLESRVEVFKFYKFSQ